MGIDGTRAGGPPLDDANGVRPGPDRVSIIVPAHNEEAVIGACLAALTEAADAIPMEIIVVCNGCADKTADVAGQFSDAVRVLSIPEPSKIHAFNRGDEVATSYPRFYVDADILLSARAVRETAAALSRRDDPPLTAAPRLEVDLRRCSWPVRAFYRIWTMLPMFEDEFVGGGVFALSAEGRARFGEFPDVIADDEFIRLLFRRSERKTVSSCSFTVLPPLHLRGLLRIKLRSRLGNLQMRQMFPELASSEPRSIGGHLRRVLKQPRLWACMPVYLFVVVATSIQARLRLLRGQLEWDRDESSRLGRAFTHATPD